MGTPQFSVPILEELAIAGYDIAAVYCQPPRSAGRGKKQRLSPIHMVAAEEGYNVRTPVSLKDTMVQKHFQNLNLDVAVVAAYGLILPNSILGAPRLGCFNVHASLLPRWRGAAPIQRAILTGDAETGVTIMQMETGLDSGPLLMQESVPITDELTGQTLQDQLSNLGAKLIVRALSGIEAGTLKAVPQGKNGITYAAKLNKNEGRINWRMTSFQIDRQVRALNSWPGAWFDYGEDQIKVLKSRPVIGLGAPGTVLEGLAVACGEGVLQLETVQRAGKGPVAATEFLNGYDLPPGTLLT